VMNAQLLYPQYAQLLLKTLSGRLSELPEKQFQQLMQAVDRQWRLLKDVLECQADPLRQLKRRPR
jgi:hypothetical protein